MDKKRTNASVLKDLGENCIFSPLWIKGKTIEKQYSFGTDGPQLHLNYLCVLINCIQIIE